MLAKSVPRIPDGAMFFEPKWDGFRSIIFRDGDEVEIGSRNEKPMTRYFPEIVEAVKASLPERLNRWSIRSRLRVGKCEFSARLFNPL
jgi:ATP-dependent DNA ligase